MPTVLRYGSMRFQIHTRNEHEPPHVHVYLPDGEVVVNLIESTRTALVRNDGRGVREIDAARAVMTVAEHFDLLLEIWSRYHR